MNKAGSILFQVTALFLGSVVLAIVIVLSQNLLLSDQTEQTLAKEIFSAESLLFDKTRDSLYERMEYYAFNSDPGRPSIWKLRGRRSPIAAIQSRNPRRIEIAIEPQFKRLQENGTLDTLIIFDKEGKILKYFAAASLENQPNLEPTVEKIVDQGLGKSIIKGFTSSDSDIQQFLVFPIYSNATVLAYVYYGLSIQTLINIFEEDSGSFIYLPDREASSSKIYSHSAKLESLELENGASIVSQLGHDFYAVSRRALDLAGSPSRIIFAKDVNEVIAENQKYLVQAIVAATTFLGFAGLVLFILLRKRLLPLREAIEVLRSLTRGDLSAKIEKSRDDEVGQISEAIDSFRESLVAFNKLQLEANKRKIAQQQEILNQTQTLADLLPVERQGSMKSTISDIEQEISKSRGIEKRQGLKVACIEEIVFNKGYINSKQLNHLAQKLPISRMQRDLTDSTTLRNQGVALCYSFIALKNILKGLNRITINKDKMLTELDNHWEVIAEAIQTILRKSGQPQAYEQLKKLTRGEEINRKSISNFIFTLKLPQKDRDLLLALTPKTYTGLAKKIVDLV